MRWLGLKAERVTCMVRVRVLGVGAVGEGMAPLEERLNA